MAALVLRIKFPITYPLIYKTLRVDANFTTNEAVKFMAETVNVSSLLTGSEGLYIPEEKKWLDPNTPLSEYDSLQDVEHIEFRDRNAPLDDGGDQGGDDAGGKCPCVVM
eukprot:TRINITY_DN1923_c0_g1_i1.p1 TRINITY_DN1923_c0_g1~~TRINITY_DN1923_c0_g1_i1.p1  ORF type:complete len:109 (-),score=27.75 TRINITY_DN1923_c0_g1_i1:191-517(-)